MKVEIADLTTIECGEIAVTAAEGGIGYWSQMDGYDWRRWSVADAAGPSGPDPIDFHKVTDDFVFYTIHELTSDENGYEEEGHDITPTLIRRGFELCLAAPLNKGGWMANGLLGVAREDWTGEIDSSGADMLIQFGVFGEVRYG